FSSRGFRMNFSVHVGDGEIPVAHPDPVERNICRYRDAVLDTDQISPALSRVARFDVEMVRPLGILGVGIGVDFRGVERSLSASSFCGLNQYRGAVVPADE